MIDFGIDLLPSNETTEELMNDLIHELVNATQKHPTWPTDPLHALAVLGEEYGELNKAILEWIYEPNKEGVSQDEIRKEAIQTAAMAIRFLISLDTYKYDRCPQHEQKF